MDKQMKERPILFSAPMVRAILEGKKSQTRRVIKNPDDGVSTIVDGQALICYEGDDWQPRPCPYGKQGDRLWVREVWGRGCRPDPQFGWVDGIEYRADEAYLEHENALLPLETMVDTPDGFEWDSIRAGWHSPIHMPRWASRITLEITDIRVERLQDISADDAWEEGVWPPGKPHKLGCPQETIEAFIEGWDKINGKRAPWSSNPWVWAISFTKI